MKNKDLVSIQTDAPWRKVDWLASAVRCPTRLMHIQLSMSCLVFFLEYWVHIMFTYEVCAWKHGTIDAN